jgi:hypothetical protein
MPAFQQSDAGRRFAIELFGFDETSAAYIQARFERSEADNRKGGFRRAWAPPRRIDVAHANLNRMFNFLKIKLETLPDANDE